MIGTLITLMVAVCTVTVINANGLKQAIESSTISYVRDVAFQLARDIDYRLAKISQDMHLMADGILHYAGQDARLGYLAQRCETMGFTALGLAELTGQTAFTDGKEMDLSQTQALMQARANENGISVLDAQRILYTVPVVEDGQVVQVLAGIRNKENMQALIQSESFDGNGLTCITDCNGNMVISAADVQMFLALDEIYVKEKGTAQARAIEQMEANMRQHIDGTLAFSTVDGKGAVMAYNALSTYDWVLLTLVPSDLIAAQSNRYIRSTFIITLITMVLFVAVILTMVYLFRRHDQEMERIAFVDPITGGMNNVQFKLLCKQLVSQAEPGTYSLISMNLKNFKLINELFSAQKGDETLRYIYGVLQKNVCVGELVARVQADTFFLCLCESDEQTVQARLDKMLEEINTFNDAREVPYYLTFALGAYLVEEPMLEVTVMQDRANMACRSIHLDSERSCAFYRAMVTERVRTEKELSDLMQGSLQNGDFKVHLQPKIFLADEHVCGAEALVRWEHPQRGTIYPSEFIPVFEQNGMICKLDLYVFEQVCSYLTSRMQAGKRLFPISVNLSRQHFKVEGFLAQFEQIRRQYGVSSEWIEMELTESIFLEDGEIAVVRDAIQQMHALGFMCSLDDFGAGYSALGLLQDFEVDAIKLDRRFFLDMTHQRAQDVVESIVSLAKRLHIATIAEGIEAPGQLAMLQRIGCNIVQGYVYARPMPLKTFTQWVDNWEQMRRQ